MAKKKEKMLSQNNSKGHIKVSLHPYYFWTPPYKKAM